MFPFATPRLVLPLALSTAVLAHAPAPVMAEVFPGGTLAMAPGTATVLSVRPGVRTVIIGDPEVVDVSVLDDKTIAVTAKAAGATNMILLDEQHAQIMQATVEVGPQSQQVRKIGGGSLRTYSCSPMCVSDQRPATDPHTTIHIARDAQGTPVSNPTTEAGSPPSTDAPPTSAPASEAPAR